ncbi:hypothetical protein PINS_up000493 [Pythium insidiosum]|nr:hypothetical protein PINS_up000493 [Pythium insidiosum]
MKYRSVSATRRLATPSDTSYQPPSLESLLFIASELREMMQRMPDHGADLVGVLDATVLKWLEDCAAIAKDIREPTLNHRHITQSVVASELLALYHKYDGYQRAKANAPTPFQQFKVAPLNASDIATAATSSSSASSTSGARSSLAEQLRQKELELEREFFNPDAWTQGTKGLLLDNSRLAMLGYINCACDYVAEFLMQTALGHGGGGQRSTSSFGSTRPFRSTAPAAVGDSAALQATSWKVQRARRTSASSFFVVKAVCTASTTSRSSCRSAMT